MATMLERMRAAQEARQKSYETDNSVYTHWKMPVGATCSLRFIPFEDHRSQGCWVERKMIPVSFLDPDDDSKLIRFQIPCLEMYEPPKSVYCPALAPVRDLYAEAKELKSEGKTADFERVRAIASAHWINLTAYYQGFVVRSGFVEENVPENPIRVFPLSKQIHKVIYHTLFENEAEPFVKLPPGEYTMDDVKLAMNIPEDYPDEEVERLLEKFIGRNFFIQHTMSSDGDKTYDAYNGGNTKWSMEEQPLTAEQLEALDKYGLHDLGKRLPERPTEEQYEVMVEMVNTSIGRLFGRTDGFWNKEWEAVGIKPYKKRGRADGQSGEDEDRDGSRKSSAGQTVRERLARGPSTASGADSDGGSADSEPTTNPGKVDLKSKLAKMRRGAPTEGAEDAPSAPQPDASAEPPQKAAEAPVESEVKAKDQDSRIAELSAKVRARIDATSATSASTGK